MGIVGPHEHGFPPLEKEFGLQFEVDEIMEMATVQNKKDARSAFFPNFNPQLAAGSP
ncbi:hypothetical protein SBA3_1530003 [Candidatus Sulfopaludibacter sp. SbA3]|nr:hypothetical protein SBA3_1530003 [Candidatus Sulfopaludibacter sp. SbA3]